MRRHGPEYCEVLFGFNFKVKPCHAFAVLLVWLVGLIRENYWASKPNTGNSCLFGSFVCLFVSSAVVSVAVCAAFSSEFVYQRSTTQQIECSMHHSPCMKSEPGLHDFRLSNHKSAVCSWELNS